MGGGASVRLFAACPLRGVKLILRTCLGRLEGMVGSDKRAAKYAYNATGQLHHVERPDGGIGYRYRDGLVSAVVTGGTEAFPAQPYAGGLLAAAPRGPIACLPLLYLGPDLACRQVRC